jgi:hypothetical protein
MDDVPRTLSERRSSMFHGDASSAISSSGCALPALLTLLSSPPIYSTACQERGSLTQPITLPMWSHTCLASMCGRGVSGGVEVKNDDHNTIPEPLCTPPCRNPTPPSPRVCLEAGCPNGAREGSEFSVGGGCALLHTHPLPPPRCKATLHVPLPPPHSSVSSLQARNTPVQTVGATVPPSAAHTG